MPNASPSSLRAYLELVRLPNLFTAMADVTMGFLFTHALVPGMILAQQDRLLLGLLLAASTALYAAGVTLNDVFDATLDAEERPERPIPSRRVSLGAAKALGWGLLAVGVVLPVVVTLLSGVARPAIVGVLLAGCILLYDRLLKRTPLGPIAMGACRGLNVLLGMSIQPIPWRAEHWLVAAAVATYIIGVTWFARTEARTSSRKQLALATAVVLLGMGLLAPLPSIAQDALVRLAVEPTTWYLLIGVFLLFTGVRCLAAVADPQPVVVRTAVTHLIHTIILLDAVACYAVRDVTGAILVFAFLPLTVFATRWARST